MNQNMNFTSEAVSAIEKGTNTTRHYEGTPFSVVVSPYPEEKPGAWSTLRVEIRKNGKVIGEYRRMYPSLGPTTFAPFLWKGQWYALYSAAYSTTRVLKLNDDSIEDWCGEVIPDGFCPAEYYLPLSFNEMYASDKGSDRYCRNFYHRRQYRNFAEFCKESDLSKSPLEFYGFGFISGCHWGDDTSWKLRYVDYSKIDEKILLIDERFGYHALPDLPLSECINLDSWEEEIPMIKIVKEEIFLGRDSHAKK